MPNPDPSHAWRSAAMYLSLAIAGVAAEPAMAAPAPSDAEVRQIREDCHTEAEAAGLKGTALEAFVDECVAEILAIELHNLSRD